MPTSVSCVPTTTTTNSAFVPPRWLPLLLLANKSQRMLLTPFPIGLASDCRYRHNMVRSLEINVKEYIYKYIYKKDCFYLLYGKPKRVASALTACTQGIFFRGYFRSNLTSFKKKKIKKIQARVRRGKCKKNCLVMQESSLSKEIFVKPSNRECD